MFLTSRNSTKQFEHYLSSFQGESAVRIPKEDFFGYDAKFASRSGKDWLLLDSICSVFLRKSL